MAAEVFDWRSSKSDSTVSQLDRQPSFYGYGAGEVSKKPLSSTAFAAFSCLQSLGHAGLALAGAACAQAMLGLSPRIPSIIAPLVSGDLVVRLALLGFVAACAKALGGMGAGFFQVRLAGAVGDALRLSVLRRRAHEVTHPRQHDQGAEVGVASTTFLAVDDLTTGIREAQAGFAASLGALKAALQLVPLALLAMWSGTRLVLVAAVVLLPFGVALARAKKRVKSAQRRTLDESATLLEATDEAVRHAELWSSYRADERVHERVMRAGRALTNRLAQAAAFTAGLSGATEALGALALLLVVLGAHAGVFGAETTDGARLLAFAVAFFMAYKPIRELAEARLAWARASAAAERLGISEVPEALHDARATVTCTPSKLELRGVRLSRGKLGVIDTCIEPGTIVAIQGATGVGKTTLLRTLLGFERVQSGEIRCEGGFAWVPQDAPIVRGTLAENVALGGPSDVRAAMEAIGAGALFDRLGAAELGVGGRALSGGEQKQVAIARALATKQPILLLDEPTTGLDDVAQAAVLSAIAHLRGKRTVLIVTHRPEPLTIADAVLVLGPSGPTARAARDAAPLVQ